ncbi:putative Ig domain-containing protein [Enterovibrio sp. Hal110]
MFSKAPQVLHKMLKRVICLLLITPTYTHADSFSLTAAELAIDAQAIFFEGPNLSPANEDSLEFVENNTTDGSQHYKNLEREIIDTSGLSPTQYPITITVKWIVKNGAGDIAPVYGVTDGSDTFVGSLFADNGFYTLGRFNDWAGSATDRVSYGTEYNPAGYNTTEWNELEQQYVIQASGAFTIATKLTELSTNTEVFSQAATASTLNFDLSQSLLLGATDGNRDATGARYYLRAVNVDIQTNSAFDGYETADPDFSNGFLSSSFNNEVTDGPTSHARGWLNSPQAWTAASATTGDWYGFTFKNGPTRIYEVTIQGRADGSGQYVSQFRLEGTKTAAPSTNTPDNMAALNTWAAGATWQDLGTYTGVSAPFGSVTHDVSNSDTDWTAVRWVVLGYSEFPSLRAGVKTNSAPTISAPVLYGDGSVGNPFTELAGASSVGAAGVYHFDLNGEAFSTFVDQEGDAFSFTPTASDLDTGDTLIFSVSGDMTTVTDLAEQNLTLTIGGAWGLDLAAAVTFPEGFAAGDQIWVAGADANFAKAVKLEVTQVNNDIVFKQTDSGFVASADYVAGQEFDTLTGFTSVPTATISSEDGYGAHTFALNGTALTDPNVYVTANASGLVSYKTSINGIIPDWMFFDASTGELLGTPLHDDVGIHTNIQIKVTDDGTGSLSSSLAPLDITVTDINNAPSTSQDYEVIADSFIRNGGYANSNYGDYNYIVVKEEGNDGYNRKGFYRFQPIDILDTGLEQVVEFRTSLQSGNSTSQTFDLYPTTDNTWTETGITWSNSPALGPLLGSNTIPGQTLNIDISQHVIDNPGAALSFRLQGTSDSYFTFVSREYVPLWENRSTLRVTRNYEDISINESEAANIVLSDQVFHDLDGDTLTLSVTGLPAGLTFSSDTISGNTLVVGDHTVTVTATDPSGAQVSTSFVLTVVDINLTPTISGTPDTTITEGSTYSFTPTANDLDSSDTLTFSVSNAPSWSSFNTATGELSGTPLDADVGTTNNIVITVTDDGAGTLSASLPAFNLSVTDINNAPTISGSPSTTIAEGSAYSFTPSANDIDASDTLTFSVTGDPSWLNINPTTGELSGTPADADVGTTNNIVVTVTDDGAGTLNASLPAFNLTVTNINNAPTISGTPATTVAEGSAYSFTPTSSDVDLSDTLTFTVLNKPSWLNINSATGELSGTPADADVGIHSGIEITVADDGAGTLSASLPAFNITVTDINNAPVISGTPATSVAEGSLYSFTPTASDADSSNTLTFTVANSPSWLSIDSVTGELSGTPADADVATYTGIAVTVTDNGTGALSATLPIFSITVTDINNAPVISGTTATSVNEGNSYTFTPTASDIDAADTLTFSITNKPTWATFDSVTGTLSGTVTNADVGTTSGIQITVTDDGLGLLNATLPAFSISVVDVNNAPTISGSPLTTVAEGSSYSFTPTITDLDGDTLTFSIVNQPAWANFNAATGELSGTPVNADVGSVSGIQITVTDSGAGSLSSALPAFDLTVTDINNPPTITGIPTTSVNEGSAYSFTPSANDLDGDTLTFSLTNKPDWLTFDTSTGTLSGTPAHADVGTITGLQLSVKDNGDGDLSAALATFNITVVDINNAPTIAGTPSTTAAEGSQYSFTPVANDLDSDTLTFSIVNLPSWASFNTTTGELSGTPGNADVGTATGIAITVTDDGAGTLSASLVAFDLTVSDINNPPIITGTPTTSVNEGDNYSFTPSASELDGDTLTFSITNKPDWLSFDPTNGAISGTPTHSDVGIAASLQISVKDNGSGELSAALPTFNITVVDINNAPTIAGTPPTSVDEGSTYSFTPVTADLDSDTLTFSIVNQPGWASFNAATGELSGIPGNGDVGTTSGIVITVTDDGTGTLSASLPAFDLTVSDINNPPIISGTPATSVNEGDSYSFTPTASDLDGDSLIFSVINKPDWLSFDTNTGALTGTPADSHVGLATGIQISVKDNGAGELSASLATFNITVVDINNAPVLSGTPATTVEEGSLYRFTPVTTDLDGDTLSFSITNKPSWASFDTATGELSGTPADADVGTTSGILISVIDDGAGTLSATLPSFNITVSDINNPPTISGTPVTSVNEGDSYSFIPTVADLDGDTLTFSVINKPNWLTLNTSTGELSGTPLDADVGISAGIQIVVTDDGVGSLSAQLAPFSLTVVDTNTTPILSGTPTTSVNEGTPYSFIPTATDGDTDTLTFSIVNQPSWLTFDSATGELSGTPFMPTWAPHLALRLP